MRRVAFASRNTPAENVAAWLAAYHAVPHEGGVLEMPEGIFDIDAELPAAKPGIIRGSGMYATVLRATIPTQHIFNTTGNSGLTGNITFQDFSLGATVTKTAGAGLAFAVDATASPLTSGCRIERLEIQQQYIGVDWFPMAFSMMTNCRIDMVPSSMCALRIGNFPHNDGGDNGVVNNVFTCPVGADPNSAVVYMLGGGGLRFAYNKLLAATRFGLYIAPIEHFMSDVMIAENSIEGLGAELGAYAVIVQDPNGLGIGNIQIHHNQIGVPADGVAIGMSGAPNGIHDVDIDRNLIHLETASSRAFVLSNVRNLQQAGSLSERNLIY